MDESYILQTLRVRVTNHHECSMMYKNVADKKNITSRQLCAGGVVGQDSCNGDSGGPLMAPFSFTSSPKYFIVGVVSFGTTICGNSKMPGVYTEVAHYMTWILIRYVVHVHDLQQNVEYLFTPTLSTEWFSLEFC
uniref:Peptidase S1 domain-containing protein n=2 Tax=Graphocephala atropunctata TaxID=36148 RepID=A0A1B6KI91_9HEMI